MALFTFRVELPILYHEIDSPFQHKKIELFSVDRTRNPFPSSPATQVQKTISSYYSGSSSLNHKEFFLLGNLGQ